MKIYNCTNYSIKLNIAGYENDTIVKTMEISEDFHPTKEFIEYIVEHFSSDNIILIPAVGHDYMMCMEIINCDKYIRPYDNPMISEIEQENLSKLNIINDIIDITNIPLMICMVSPDDDVILPMAQEEKRKI